MAWRPTMRRIIVGPQDSAAGVGTRPASTRAQGFSGCTGGRDSLLARSRCSSSGLSAARSGASGLVVSDTIDGA